jgi:transcriptional regulator with PAS, ATPase and Fis domain
MPLEVQAKVLRVLQERVVQPLGGTKAEPVDVRIIAATNVNLKEAVRQGRFRADLFYRLNVVPIEIPPLRDRSEDVAPLVSHFLSQICKRERLPLKTVTPSVEHCLADQAWPGNVRELEHAIERAIALSGDRTDLDIYDFEPFSSVMALSDAVSDAPIEGRVDFEGMVSQFERALIDGALRRAVGNKARAASMLRLKRSTFISKIKALEVCA